MRHEAVVPRLGAARRALWWILGLSVVGIAFSGTLSYRELCLAASGGCGVAQGGVLLGIPVCVYGLVMYLLVGGIAATGLRLSAGAAPRAGQPGEAAPSPALGR
jgi:hypothetical protein